MHRPFAFLALVTAMSLLRTALLCADELVLKHGARVQGTFEGFKNDRISFAPREGQKMQHPLLQVDSLTVEPPARVAVKPRGGKRMEEVRLVAFTNRMFSIEQDGRIVRLPSASLSMIETELDFSRAMALQAKAETLAAPDEDAPVEALLQTGAVTVVQFHMPDVVASVRQGNYVQGVADQSHGKVKLAVVTLDGFDSPAAAKYQIQVVPQFWFYNRRGKLVRKLAGQFEESEIDRALRDSKQ